MTKTVAVIDEFEVGKCTTCGLTYVTNPLAEEELPGLYCEQYFLNLGASQCSPDSADRNMQRHYWFSHQRAAAIARIKKPARLLDVGCGPGYFLLAAQKSGWNVTGLDISAKAASFARQQFGLAVGVGELEKTELPEESFDAITLWDVLEHTPHPLRTLKQAHGLLKRDGILIAEVDNINNILWRIRRRGFPGCAGPRYHRYYFSLSSFVKILKLAGFKTLSRFDCRYREGRDFRSGIRRMIKAPLFALNLDYFVTLIARK